MLETLINFRWWETGEIQGMAVSEGRVQWRDGREASGTDCGGKTLMPAFIDSHCHILPTGLDLQKLHLGTLNSHEEVLSALANRLRDKPEPWLRAVHYDQNRYGSQGHLTREQLDAISLEVPILLRHANGHASVASSAALRAANVPEDQADLPGGAFGRDSNGRLNGVLFEDAHELVSRAAPKPTASEMTEAILAAGVKMHSLGIACASDMMTGASALETEIEAYREAARRSNKIRVRLYVQWAAIFGSRGIGAERLRELAASLDQDRVRVAGVKIFADGAIASATAAIYGHFQTEEPKAKSGQLMYAPERLKQMVRTAHDAGFQIAIHSIGDRSTDLVMDAYSELDDPKRHRIEHAMMLSNKQIDRMASLGIRCTMQPEFLLRFGTAYFNQLGPDRAAKLKRFRSVDQAGIPLSFSSDRPIVPGDPEDGLEVAASRPDGFDAAENVTREMAIRAYTKMGADANGESELMGSLLPGQLADYRLLTL